MDQLQRSAPDPRVGRLGDDLSVLLDSLGRFGDHLAGHCDAAGLHRRAGLGATVEDATLDEQLIDTLPGHAASSKLGNGL